MDNGKNIKKQEKGSSEVNKPINNLYSAKINTVYRVHYASAPTQGTQIYQIVHVCMPLCTTTMKNSTQQL